MTAAMAMTALAISATTASGSPGRGLPPMPELTIACTDAVEDVYVTPDDLPPWGPSVLGDVVRCAVGSEMSVAEVDQRLQMVGVVGVTPLSGAKTYYLAYRTTRWEGQEGLGTARLYLPDTLHPGAPLPILVATHGTVGLADRCAPSHFERISDYLTLPFVGQGFVVIAPDYAGLGGEGTQGYGASADTAHSVIDAARATREVVTVGSLAPGTMVAGHSQGGGAALSAQAFDSFYGDSDLLGAIAFAPGWPHDTVGLWWLLNFPMLFPYNSIRAPPATLSLYADAANFIGPGHETDYFQVAVRSAVDTAVREDCILGLLFSLPPLGATFADVLDETFLQTARSCLAQGPGCGPPGEGYVQRAVDNIVSADPSGGAVLILQGLEDERATAENTACIVDKLIADGVTPQACTLADADHDDIVDRTVAFAADWAFALAAGVPLPECEESTLPPCVASIFADGFEDGDTSAWSETSSPGSSAPPGIHPRESGDPWLVGRFRRRVDGFPRSRE